MLDGHVPTSSFSKIYIELLFSTQASRAYEYSEGVDDVYLP
jgi:hypothetical protein